MTAIDRTRVVGDIETLRGEWQALAGASGNIFSTPEWCSIWVRHFGAGPLRLVECRSADGQVIAIWPLFEAWRRPWRVLRMLGHGPADEMGPVCAPDHRHEAVAALRQAFSTGDLSCDAILLEHLPSNGEWGDLGGKVLQRQPSPIITIGGRSWDDFLAGRSRNFREQTRRRERGLAKAHRLRFRRTQRPEELEEDLSTLYALHAMRWPPGHSEAFTPQLQAFHLEFAATALARNWLRLWVLEADDRPVAAWYGFRFAGSDSFYQAGRDPEWESRSVGSVLLVHTIRDAFSDGMSEYRLLRGGEDYKSRYATDDLGLETVAAPVTRGGRALVATVAGVLSLPDPIRRVLVDRLR